MHEPEVKTNFRRVVLHIGQEPKEFQMRQGKFGLVT